MNYINCCMKEILFVNNKYLKFQIKLVLDKLMITFLFD